MTSPPQKKCLKRKKSLNPRNLKNRPCCTHCFVHWYQLFTSVVHFRKVERTVHRISLVYVMNVSLCLSLSLLVSFFCIGLLSVPFFLDFPPLFRLSLRVSMFKGRCCTPVTLMFETDVELRVKKRRERKKNRKNDILMSCRGKKSLCWTRRGLWPFTLSRFFSRFFSLPYEPPVSLLNLES